MTAPSFLPRLTREEQQGRLLKLAAVFLIGCSVILTLSPAARERTWAVDYRWSHWLATAIWIGGFALAARQMARLEARSDPLLLSLAALLSGWGLLSVWRLDSELGLRQAIWLGIALAATYFGLRAKDWLGLLRRYKYLWLFLGLLLTSLTLLFGTNPLGIGPRLWLGCCGLYLQPSEPLKLLLIIYLAAYLADRQPLVSGLLPLLAPSAVMIGLGLLLLLVQRDLGTATIFMGIYTAVIYAATGRQRLVYASVLTLAAAALAGYWLFDVVQLRFEAWVNPWLDPSGRSYQIVQSLMAVAGGGLLGRGPGMGSPGLVPIAHSDFIYSTIAEENGLAGALALILLIALLSLRALRIALGAENAYHRLLATGIGAYLSLQSILIIGGNIRLLPLTGVTLPFVSYGGSSLVTSFLAVLILLRIQMQSRSRRTALGNAEPIFQLGTFFLAGLLAAGLTTGWWAIIRGPDLLTRTDNARRSISDRYVLRGSLLDRHGEIINQTTGISGNYEREYLHPEMGPISGYTHPVYGQAGLEASLDEYLRGLAHPSAWEIWTNHLLYGQPPPGLDVQLSLDMTIQTQAQALLGNQRGAAVLLDAETGEILAMASSPSFDPNLLDTQWSRLVSDEDSPLFNRAALGSYPPGTALAPFLLAEASEENALGQLPTNLEYTPSAGIVMSCTRAPSDGTSWAAVVAAGCPGPLAALGLELGPDRLLGLFEELGLYSAPALRLETRASPAPATIARPQAAAVGQDELLISPLQLALAATTLSNGGILPAPRIAVEVEHPGAGWDELPALGEAQRVWGEDLAALIANQLAREDGFAWQMIATAFDEEGKKLTWYLAGTLPGAAESPRVVVVLLESFNPAIAEFIGETLLGMGE